MCTAAVLGAVCFTNLTADKASAKTSGDYKYVITGKKPVSDKMRRRIAEGSFAARLV